MNNDAMLKKYIYNGNVYDTSQNEGFNKTDTLSIYEVIRVKNGVILFKEEHLNRMEKSAEMLGYKMKKSKEEITEEIIKLVNINEAINNNIKLVCSNLDSENQNFLTYFTKSSYNIEDVPKIGASTIVYRTKRDNPNIKIINAKQREEINKSLKENNAFEALLENEEGYITEGSRSNMLFVKGDKVYTAPAKDVLIGITRSKIMNICKELRIDVIEKNIHISEIKDLDGVFMSTTPIGVLPIVTIDDIKFDSMNNKTIINIMNGYESLVEDYIKNNR
ncbi:aminotransferase class IV [Gottschalkia acidurici]|nr:aminotransferase class IV [Gottschalkia acidurici]